MFPSGKNVRVSLAFEKELLLLLLYNSQDLH